MFFLTLCLLCSLDVMIVRNHFCLLFSVASLLLTKFCLNILRQSPASLLVHIFHATLVQRIVPLLRKHEGILGGGGPWSGSVQADLMARRLCRSWLLVKSQFNGCPLQPKAHHPCTGTNLCGSAVKGHHVRGRRRCGTA